VQLKRHIVTSLVKMMCRMEHGYRLEFRLPPRKGLNCVLLGCYAACGGNFLATFRNNLLDSWPLKTVPTGCPETSTRNYHYSLRNYPEQRSYHGYWSFTRILWFQMKAEHFRADYRGSRFLRNVANCYKIILYHPEQHNIEVV